MATQESVQQVYLTPPDARWPAAFAREAALVSYVLGNRLLAVHHIGSTAIRGIHAKPIIDMLLVIDDLTAFDASDLILQHLTALGYEAKGEFGMAGRRYFRKNDARGNRSHQMHGFQAGSPEIQRHLAFRDFLNSHPTQAQQYSELKLRLAAEHPWDISQYTDGKDEFIQAIDQLANHANPILREQETP